jgi:hypothetical protein
MYMGSLEYLFLGSFRITVSSETAWMFHDLRGMLVDFNNFVMYSRQELS